MTAQEVLRSMPDADLLDRLHVAAGAAEELAARRRAQGIPGDAGELEALAERARYEARIYQG